MSFQEAVESPRRPAYETVDTPDQVPRVGLVPIRGPGGQVLDAYRGVEREDNHEIVSVVSSRYGLVGHREVALAVHQVGQALESPAEGELASSFPRESIRLYSGGRRMEVKLVVGRKFHLAEGEDLFPGLRVLNSLDGSWAVRLSGFAVRVCCSNQLFAAAGNVVEWRELHLSSGSDLLSQLRVAIHEFLDRFRDGLGLYTRSMQREILADEVEPALLGQGFPQLHAGVIGARAERQASHVGTLSRWSSYQVATSYLTRELDVNPDRERFLERAAARALLLPTQEGALA